MKTDIFVRRIQNGPPVLVYWIVREEGRQGTAMKPFACAAPDEESAIRQFREERGAAGVVTATVEGRERALEAVAQELLWALWGTERTPEGAVGKGLLSRMQEMMAPPWRDPDVAHNLTAAGWKIGERAWFVSKAATPEWDGEGGNLDRRSGLPAMIMGLADPGRGSSLTKRKAAGKLRLYRIRFEDGFEAEVAEDELVVDESFTGAKTEAAGATAAAGDGIAPPAPLEPFTVQPDGDVVDARGRVVAKTTKGCWPPEIEALLARGLVNGITDAVIQESIAQEFGPAQEAAA